MWHAPLRNPVGVYGAFGEHPEPRVAAARQPWAVLRKPFGLVSTDNNMQSATCTLSSIGPILDLDFFFPLARVVDMKTHKPTPNPAAGRKPPRPDKKHRETDPQPGPDIPHWISTDERWRDLPKNIREAVPKILAPAYRRFVLEAPGELERTVGITLVHLAWLELCDQIQMADAVSDPTSLDAILKNPEEMLDRHFRLATIKCQVAELLLKIQVVQNALNRPSPQTPALTSPLPLEHHWERAPMPENIDILFPHTSESSEEAGTTGGLSQFSSDENGTVPLEADKEAENGKSESC
jgi:hypothetical protein